MYGTLRPETGHPMAALLADYSDRLGPATFAGTLIDLGGYPGLVPSGVAGSDGLVQGEVLRLRDESMLHHVDAYEGPDYERARREVVLWDGSPAEAWVYLYRGPVPPDGARVPGGDWLAR